MIKKIARNLAALFTGEVISRICHFIAVVYIARIFGVAGFGAINFSLAILSYFLMVTNLGLGEIGVREIARKKDAKDVVETIVSMRLGIAVISFLAMLSLVFLTKDTMKVAGLIIVYGLTMFPYATSLEWVFRGKEEMKYNAFGRAINATLYLVLIILFVHSLEDLIKVALITLLADVTTSYFYYKNYNRKYGRIKLHLDIKRWLEMGKVSSQLFVSSALFVIYMNFGTIALGFMKNENAVGIYGAAAKLTFFIYALSDLFVAATFPVVSRLYHESKEKLGEFMRYCLKITVLLGLPVAVGGTILGPKIIALVYGVSYVQSGGVFQILSWFAAINLTSFVLSYSLVACDRQHTYMKVMVAGVIANVIFNIIAIPMAGYYASAAALVITESVTLLLSSLLVRRFVKLPSLGSYTRLVAAVFVMAGTLLLLHKLNVAALAVISVGVYFGASVAFGGITRSDINRLREVFA